jgi:cytochrome c oxidase subunit 4
MEEKKHHISSYNSLLVVLIGLFIMTAISVMVTEIHFSTFSVGVALLLASVKGYLVLTYFMHLKYDEPIFRIMVILVLLLFAIVIGITFIDYLLR